MPECLWEYFFFCQEWICLYCEKVVVPRCNPSKTGSVGGLCWTWETVLSFVLALVFTADTECLASAVVQQQPVLLACVVSWPRAMLWNKTKPPNHQLVLQKLILFQIPLLLCEILGFVDLAGWLQQSYHITARSGLSVKPLTQVAYLIPKDATHKGCPWHLRASKFLPGHLN